MNALVNPSNTDLAKYNNLFEVDMSNNDLSAGVGDGFGYVSIRGSKWRVRRGGEEKPVLNDEGEPVATLPVVMLQASEALSRIFYEKKYTEGDDVAPDCTSLEGVVPDADSPKKQSATCASCPHQVWGSVMTDAGKKAKRCQDSRRVAVVPLNDIPNERDGGPLLLRVPAASLKDLSLYGKQLLDSGFHYRAVGTRLGFDMDASYPKLTYKAIAPLTDEQKEQAKAHFMSGAVDSILEISARPAAPVATAAPAATSTVDSSFETDVVEAEAAATKPVLAAVKEEPPAEAAASSELDEALDDALNMLDDLHT
jgi:hypothetical protein